MNIAHRRVADARLDTHRLWHAMATLAWFAISALFVGTSAAAFAADESDRPNIVLIMVDDMGYGDAGCYNPDSKIPTPAIDRMATEGMRFTDAHAPAGVCVPTRFGLMTGRYPFRTSYRSIPAGQTTVASLLNDHGYRTGMVGKWHLSFENEKKPAGKQLSGGPVDRGFGSYFGIPASLDIPPYYYIRDARAVAPPSDHVAASNTPGWTRIQGAFWRAGGVAPGFKHIDVLPKLEQEAVAWLDSAAGDDEPFFLYLALPGPHTPWVPTKDFNGKSKAGLYGDFTAQVDSVVGSVLKKLDDKQASDNTLVIFTSDNGPVWYDADEKRFGHDATGPLTGMKGDAWEGGHRMPFVVRWPAVIKASQVSDALICHTDMLATFAGILEVELPAGAGQDSLDQLPVLRGDELKQPVRNTLITLASKNLLAVREGPWKLIPSLSSGGFSRAEVSGAGGVTGQLYHLGNDIGETNNLWKQEPDRVAHMQKLLKATRGQK